MTLDTSGTGIILALTNSVPGREAEFNKWYDDVHVLPGRLPKSLPGDSD